MSAKNTVHKTIWLWLFLLPLFTTAQNFRLIQFTTHEGLPIDNIYAAAQDNDRFMWFGTDFGIARYDGYQFTNYDRKNGMANKAVTDIVYAGGDSLIFFSYPITLQAIHKDGHINTLVDSAGFALQQLTKHQQQYYCYKRTSSTYGIWENKKYNLQKADSVFGKPGTNINCITSLGEKGVAFCTDNGLFIKNGPQTVNLLSNQKVLFAVYTSRKTILAVVDNKLVEFDEALQYKELAFSFTPGFTVYHAAEDKNGAIWFRGLDKGVYMLYQNELQEMSSRISMENKIIHEFFPDADGNFWFCTDGSGILLKKNSAFVNYEIRDGLANNKIFRLLKQNDEILIGTSNGLSVLKNKTISVFDLPNADKGLKYVTQLFRATDNIAGICIDKTFSFSTDRENEESLVKDFSINQHNFRAFKLQFGWQQDENNIWTLSASILEHIQKANDKREVFNLSAYKVRKAYCMIAYEDKLWLGTDAGIIFIDKNKISKKDSIGRLKIGEVFKFLMDKKNRLWVATDAGLFLYENKEFTIRQTGKTAGGNYCKDISEDAAGRIWVATWDGVFMLDGNKENYYNTNDGLPSKTANCILADTTNRLVYIGTDNGLAVLQETGFVNAPNSRKIYISCSLAGKGELQVDGKASLSPQENNLSFYLSFPYYQGKNEVYYEYRLDDGPWTGTSNPSILISDIGSGKHNFYARAKINDEIISSGETVFKFYIKTPFYKTWWFWLIAAIIFQFIIFRIINHFNKKAKEKKNAAQSQQAEYASLKQQAFTLLMNPHFIFNALNSVQYYINRQDRQTANKYLSNFATLIRRSFEASQKSFVTLEEELETIRLYLQLEKMRFTDKFEYNIHVSKEAVDDDWMLPSMMLQPFLENAVLHGLMPLEEKGMLTIDVTAENNSLQIIIIDNGIGIEKSKTLRSGSKHSSKGMQLINERIELLSRLSKEPIALKIAQADPAAQNPGTKITLIIPQEVYEVYQQQRNPA